MVDPDLIFIKLGGSLITDKDTPNTARTQQILQLLQAIQFARTQKPALKIILGHGSGSFGHTAGNRFNTRAGVYSAADWQGFQLVWQAAHALNQVVIEQCQAAGLPVIVFPPSASVLTDNHQVVRWELEPLTSALERGLLPLVFGDVVFDKTIGGTILSTEELFAHLAPILKPARILLAGIEAGVWADYPACTQLLPLLSGDNYQEDTLQGSASVDVTGGMRSKVNLMMALCRQVPGLQAQIFSALEPNALADVILNADLGTRISA